MLGEVAARCCLDLGTKGAALTAEATDPPDGTNGVAFALPILELLDGPFELIADGVNGCAFSKELLNVESEETPLLETGSAVSAS